MPRYRPNNPLLWNFEINGQEEKCDVMIAFIIKLHSNILMHLKTLARVESILLAILQTQWNDNQNLIYSHRLYEEGLIIFLLYIHYLKLALYI